MAAMQRRVKEMNVGVENELFDLVQESIIVRDQAGRITGWNAGSESLYGWNRSEASRHTGVSVDPIGALVRRCKRRKVGRDDNQH